MGQSNGPEHTTLSWMVVGCDVIDGVALDWDSLGEKLHALLAGIRAADQELARLQAQISLAQTALGTFSSIVKQSLPKREAA